MRSQYRLPAPRKTDRPSQADRLLKYLTPQQKRYRTLLINKILSDPDLGL